MVNVGLDAYYFCKKHEVVCELGKWIDYRLRPASTKNNVRET